MKKLMLIRHAKATHESGFKDFERPLTHKGFQEAEKMAMRLHHEDLKPDALIASPALRTLSTANVFSEMLMMHQAETVKAIYDAGEDTLLEVISEFDNEHNFIGLVGHNPAISQVLYALSGIIKEVPPCTVAIIHFEANAWADINTRSGRLSYYSTPNDQLTQ